MKSNLRKVSLFLMLLIFSYTTFAQLNSYGFIGGVNLSTQSKTDVNKSLHKMGWHAGLYADYMFGKKVGIELGIFYASTHKSYEFFETSNMDDLISTLGNLSDLGLGVDIDTLIGGLTDYVSTDLTSTTRGNVTLSYINIPISAVFKIQKLKITAGAYISILASATTREELTQDIPLLDILTFLDDQPLMKTVINTAFPGYSEPDFSESTDRGNYNPIDYGVQASIAYTADNGLFFGVSYSYGFAEFFTENIENFSTHSQYNSIFRFSLGFDIGKTKVAELVKF